MTRPNQSQEEISVFKEFVTCSKQPIDLTSILTKPPPSPDIECRYNNGESISFELVEFLDREFQATVSGSLQLKDAFYEYLNKLPAKQREAMARRYGNADILVNYQDGLNFKKRNSSIPLTVTELLSQTEDPDTGLIENFANRGLSKLVKTISVARGKFKGPLFNIQILGGLDDPCIYTIESKLTKTYTTTLPIELLAYIDGNPMYPDDVWIPKVRSYLAELTSITPFRKIWVFDRDQKFLKYEFPES